ncbi:hypothetical protein [Burkholderia ambifaria]
MLKDATASSCFTIAVVIPTSLLLPSHDHQTRPSDPYDFSVAIPHRRASKQPSDTAANTARALQRRAARRIIDDSPAIAPVWLRSGHERKRLVIEPTSVAKFARLFRLKTRDAHLPFYQDRIVLRTRGDASCHTTVQIDRA